MEPSPSRKFIDERLGGTGQVARAVGRGPNAVRMWIHRRRIPRAVWPDILKAYPKVKLDELRAVEAAERAA